jgi:hypothetical protein
MAIADKWRILEWEGENEKSVLDMQLIFQHGVITREHRLRLFDCRFLSNVCQHIRLSRTSVLDGSRGPVSILTTDSKREFNEMDEVLNGLHRFPIRITLISSWSIGAMSNMRLADYGTGFLRLERLCPNCAVPWY